MLIKKILLTLLLLAGFQFIQAASPIKYVMIGVNGLTCSACSRTVEVSLRKLDFVSDVQMNLEHTEGKILFKENSDPDIDKIATAITNAGFSVRYLSADIDFNAVKISNGQCYTTGNYNLLFINSAEKTLNGETELKFIGPQFQPKNDYNKVKKLLVNSCYTKDQKFYYVMI